MDQPTDINKKTEQIGAIMVLVLVVIIALIYLVIKPQTDSLKQNNIQAAAKKTLYNDQAKQIANLTSLSSQLASSATQVQQLSTALPKHQDVSELIVQLSAIATSQGLTISSLNPSTSQSAIAPTESTTSSQPTVGTYDFTLSITGTYSQIYGFLQALETNLRPINIQKVDFASGSGSDPTISANMTMETYYQN